MTQSPVRQFPALRRYSCHDNNPPLEMLRDGKYPQPDFIFQRQLRVLVKLSRCNAGRKRAAPSKIRY